VIELLIGLVGLQAMVLLAAIPWAYSVHGRIVAIESRLIANLDLVDRVTILERDVLTLQIAPDHDHDHD
jgi:hypothetical protein